jgi:RHS repeat-associated protein
MNLMRTFRRLGPFVAGPLAAIVFLTLGGPYAHAQDEEPEPEPIESREGEGADLRSVPVTDRPLPEDIASELEGERPLSQEELEMQERLRDAEGAQAPAEVPTPDDATYALPTGEAKSAVTPSRISLPNAEGSIEGMGESFAPVLSSGTATFSVPIALPAGRNGVQPSLGLSYASTGGNSSVGFGWNLSVPFIVRQSDLGLPRYIDEDQWHGREDRFFYNGGQELVPVQNDVAAIVDGYAGPDATSPYPGTDAIPADVVGWQQYRARIEGGFMRFFRSPDAKRWVVQGKDGTRFDFGLLPLGEGPVDLDPTAALHAEHADGTGRIYGWYLTRMSDPHGSTVYYRYRASSWGNRYLDDVFYLSPDTCAGGAPPTLGGAAAARACGAALGDYGVRVHFDYAVRTDVFTSYTAGWGIAEDERLSRIVVTAADDEVGSRYLVRRYHLSYLDSADSFHSLLASVQVEGRPDSPETGNVATWNVFSHVDEATALSTTEPLGRSLPAMTFGYTDAPTGPVAGFGGVASTVYDIPSSPSVSADAARADLFDVNSDGLPDLVVTDPARYRTDDGAPAAGVFFNGFEGDGVPTYPGTFSSAIPVGLPSGLSGTMNLASSTIVPMDVEGDGRSDFLHLPRRDRYGFFAPTRMSDDVTGNSVRPSEQGWRFTYADVSLGPGGDPRIDLVREPERYRTMDVNGDHLIDILKTTGRSMQTWLNLGTVPGGEGQFGQAIWNDATRSWDLSNDPHETCLMHDGNPLDFSDPELRTADMNGDGLVDLVRLRRGRILYWPARGTTATGAPVFGLGPEECPAGFASGREIRMSNPPAELNVELDGVYLSDVNGDGATDVVQVRFRDVDVWFNQGGEGFTERTTISTPAAPGFSPNVRLADIDGSGTLDIVYTNAGRWQYIDLAGGQRARLLDEVHNGLGASTHLTYGSSAGDYIADLAAAHADPGAESFTWSKVSGACDAVLSTTEDTSAAAQERGDCVYRSGGSPVNSTVVRQVESDDHFNELGRERNITQTSFAYHDGYYEGIEQEFRGFGAADAIAHGDAIQPTAITRTHFRQGRRPTHLASDRLTDNPREALKGRQWLSEVFDESGTFLSSSHATVRIRQLMTGQDGRGVYYGYVSQTDELRYGTTGAAPGSGEVVLPAVETQTVDPATGEPGGLVTEETRAIPIRLAEYAHIRATTDDVDNLGQVLRQRAHGRIAPTTIVPADSIIESVSTPELVSGAGWIWRTQSSHIVDDLFTCPSGGSCRLGLTTNTYNEVGDVVRAEQTAERPLFVNDYEFGGDSFGAEDFGTTPESQVLEATTAFDGWGSPLETCAGADVVSARASCARYASVVYDEAYAQLPETESVAVHQHGGSYCDTSVTGGGQFCMVSTEATWDRGFGALLSALDPNGETSTVEYDGLGRLAAVRPPDHPGDTCTGRPTQTFHYDLLTEGLPVSMVETFSHFQCSGNITRSRSYVDGLGRPRAALGRTQSGFSGGRKWDQNGVSDFSARGTAYEAYNPVQISSDPPTPVEALAKPDTPHSEQYLDAFGRPIELVERDGSKSRMEYGALETRAFDALDTGEEGSGAGRGHVFMDTPTISRVDGHGRPVEQVLHNRVPGAGADEFYRLQNAHRADGVVFGVRRFETEDAELTDPSELDAIDGHELIRFFWYDTAGRRIGTIDPDSDSQDPSKPYSRRGWRYLFNRVGDLIAVRDARGCGQNFYYDHAGRLVAEDYVECDESEEPGSSPDMQDGLDYDSIAIVGQPPAAGVEPDVRHYFDEAPHYASSMGGLPAGTHLVGRLTGSVDRAQRSAVDYDARGRAVWSARQMVVLPDAVAAVTSISDPRPTVEDGTPSPPPVGGRNQQLFDTAHTYVSTSEYDRVDRPVAVTLPEDPDFGAGPAPEVSGRMTYDDLGLPRNFYVGIDGDEEHILTQNYNEARLPALRWLRNASGGANIGYVNTYYDDRLRPRRSYFVRRSPYIDETAGSTDINAVKKPFDYRYVWDVADNLMQIRNTGRPFDPAAIHPSYETRESNISHDALYRVIGVDYRYKKTSGWSTTPGPATDWRAEQAHHAGVDPMHRNPAPMVSAQPTERPRNFTYEYDWLANQTEWTDDANAFYERSLGTEILNGHEAGKRPAALYFASNLLEVPDPPPPTPDPSIDRGGWVSLEYGESGNVLSMTVRGQCHDTTTLFCDDPETSTDPDYRDQELAASCDCDVEHHYQYRWDELNRLAEARRYDRGAGLANWELQVRQRYRYDGANVRMIKQTDDSMSGSMLPARAALYVYPGDFERRGLEINGVGDEWVAGGNRVETQYLIAGSRLTWREFGIPGAGGTGFNKDARLTYAVTDLIQSTAAVFDLYSGQLVEQATYYPNGGRETLRTDRTPNGEFSLEPMGFTGKEGDDEVGLVYFGERYLMPHLGRWASPDPLQVHAGGGGEFGNSYHYVSGNLLQGRDPTGLGEKEARVEGEAQNERPHSARPPREETRAAMAELEQQGMPSQRELLDATVQGRERAWSEGFADALNNAAGGPSESQLDDRTRERASLEWDSDAGRWRSSYHVNLREHSLVRRAYANGYSDVSSEVSSHMTETDSAIFVILVLSGGSARRTASAAIKKTDRALRALRVGAQRRAQHGANWSEASLSEVVERLAPDPRVSVNGGKVIFRNRDSGVQVVYDVGGDYFRVENTAARTAPARYLDVNGNEIPANVPIFRANGTQSQAGVPSRVRQSLTHFRNTD